MHSYITSSYNNYSYNNYYVDFWKVTNQPITILLLLLVTRPPTDPPVYTVDSRIAVVEGDLVRINLTLDANPDPTSFTWTRDGVPFTPPPGGSVGVNFIDFGGPINRTAGGSYTVQSTNDAGTGNATFQLEILCENKYNNYISAIKNLM